MFIRSTAYQKRRCSDAGFEALDVMWLESPTVPEDIPGQARIGTGIGYVRSDWGSGHAPVLNCGRYLNAAPATSRCPILRAPDSQKGKRIASLADTYNIPVTPHIGGGAVSCRLPRQSNFPRRFPNFLIMEHSPEAYEMKGQITTRKPTVKDGAFILDDTPGLGVTIDTAALEAFAIKA